MKKLLYAFMAILFASASTKAQTNPCEGKANFQFTINTSTVSFFSLNTSNVVLNHRWTFGDGNTSDKANPIHTYQFPGNYRVVHYIKDAAQNCYDSIVKEFQLTFTTPCDLLQPKFEWKRDSANPAKISFMNLSQPNAPPTTIIYKWSFGDGTYSTEKNPTHLYTTPGQFEVCLSISYPNTNCIKRFCTIVSVPAPCNLQPYFSWNASSSNPLTIKFTNQTITTTANAEVKWSFGDGTGSAEWNPTHTYTKAGIYKVCLKVAISNTCVQEFCKEVVVRDCNIETDFKWAIDSVFPLRGVKFYPQPNNVVTVMPLSIKWSFGDGTYSTEYSPFHQYQQPGTYKVCLRIEYYAGCVKEVCKEITIPVPVHCEKLSEFKYERITSISNAFVFAALTQVSTLKYTWTFGDGTGALGPNAKHQYERPGKYTVCLTVYRGDNCASTTCKEIVVGPLNCEQTYIKFEYHRLNAIGNVIKFKAISNQPVLYQKWTIWKDNGTVPVILTTQDPTYTFTQAGVYKVCLRAITGNGCVKEYCEVITIHNAEACTLQLTPNPATTQITFRIELPGQLPVVASIVDAMGVRRAVFYLNGTAGWNSFTLPVSTLPTGYYTLEVKVGNRICKGRFQKLN